MYKLVVKQLKQHQNTLEAKFIVCLSRATKNFPPGWPGGGSLPCLLGRVMCGEGMSGPACPCLRRGSWVLSAPACRGQSWRGSVPLRFYRPWPRPRFKNSVLFLLPKFPRRDEDTVFGGGQLCRAEETLTCTCS